MKEHKCENMPKWIFIGLTADNEWRVNHKALECRIFISFCPYCGEKLPEPECEDGIYIMDSKIMGGKTVMRKTWNVWAQFGTEHHVPHKDLAKHGFRIIRKINLNE